MQRMLWNVLFLLLLAYAALVALATIFQSRLVYFPQMAPCS